MKCEKCGNEIHIEAKFCPYCMSKVRPKVQKAKNVNITDKKAKALYILLGLAVISIGVIAYVIFLSLRSEKESEKFTDNSTLHSTSHDTVTSPEYIEATTIPKKPEKYRIESDTLIISGEGEMKESYSALVEYKYITKVIVEEGITSIANNAFENTKIREVVLPNTIEEIGEAAFSGCEHLREINLPEGLRRIGRSAFLNCIKLENIVLPRSIKFLSESIFCFCTGLKTVTILSEVNKIPSQMFNYCIGIEKVELPETVVAIGYDAFSGCESLKELVLPESVVRIDNGAFGGCVSLTVLELPDNIVSIGDYAFCGLDNLTSVNLPNKLSSLGKDVFERCWKLNSVKIPETVAYIDGNGLDPELRLTLYVVKDSYGEKFCYLNEYPNYVIVDK